MANEQLEAEELRDDALDAVSGGKPTQPATTTPPKQDQHGYLKITLTDVLITS